MSELIFCCPNCLTVASAGVILDDASLARAAKAQVAVSCATCGQFSRIAVADFLRRDSFLLNGWVIPRTAPPGASQRRFERAVRIRRARTGLG